MKRLSFFLLSLSIFNTSLVFTYEMGANFLSSKDPEIEIQNRVLLKINNKAITVMDLVRKLDLYFYRQFPEYAEVAMAKYQFYVANWRAVLDTMIDDALIIADAAEKKIEVSDGDVREEMEDLFGPDVVYNLDRIGWSYEEAIKILKDEFIVKRMVQMMVRSKATVAVHPRQMRQFYEKMADEEPQEPNWDYRVLTVAGTDSEATARAINEAFHNLVEKGENLDSLVEVLKQKNLEARLSEFTRKTSELSEAHKAILEQLQPGTFSEPQLVQSKTKSTYRIFKLQEKKESVRLAFQSVEKKIASKLLQEAMSRENTAYIEKLRLHFGITEDFLTQMVPEDFQPFQLR